MFLRGLGFIYAMAFASLAVQISGLVGSRGMAPAAALLKAARDQLGAGAYLALPTLCWISVSDGFLKALAWSGAAAGAGLAAGVASFPCALFAWAAYLSLVSVGAIFLQYQWDTLLLETGFLALFLCPLTLGRSAAVPVRGIWWTLRWLLFRLMAGSGLVKLMSGDPLWRGLTALQVHFETQPLPHALAYFFHQTPPWVLSLWVVLLFVVEIVFPFGIFLRGKARKISFWGLVGLQALIVLSGNYGFFNPLAVLLCLTLLEDDDLPGKREPPPAPSRARWVRGAAAGGLLFLGVAQFGAYFFPSWRSLPFNLGNVVEPLRLVNSYGLFAVMTRERDEVVVEGSRDGKAWRPYRFRWKPDEPGRMPVFTWFHMPRLDWQMWFLAFESLETNPWFQSFLIGLFQGSPEILGLLRENPFPDGPPAYLRCRRIPYHFAPWSVLRTKGEWWIRGQATPFCPVLHR